MRSTYRRAARLAVAGGAAIALTLGSALPATAAAPPTGTTSYVWKSAFCSVNPKTGRFELHGQLRSDVKVVATTNATRKYYLRIKLTFQDGISPKANYWHTFDSKTRDGGTFTINELPTYSVNGFKSIVGATLAYNQTFRVRAIVTLKRVIPGPDLTTWKYTTYSSTFTCPTDSDSVS